MQCQALIARSLSACLASFIPRMVARGKMWVLACLRDVDSAERCFGDTRASHRLAYRTTRG